jgi:hypothetical protein
MVCRRLCATLSTCTRTMLSAALTSPKWGHCIVLPQRVSLESPAQAGRLAQVATITGLRTLSLHFFASSVPELIYLTALKSLGTLNMFCQTTEAASEQDYHHLFTMAAQLSQLNRLCVSLSHGCDTGSSSLMQVLSCTSSLKQLRIDSLSISGFYTLLRHAPATLTALWVTVKTGPWAWGAMSSWPAFPVLQQNTLPNLEGLTIVGPPGILLCFATLESVAKLRLIPELPHVFTPDIYHVVRLITEDCCTIALPSGWALCYHTCSQHLLNLHACSTLMSPA